MRRSGLEIPIVDMLILNMRADIRLLEAHYNKFVKSESDPNIEMFRPGRQTMRLKLSEGPEHRINLTLTHSLLPE